MTQQSSSLLGRTQPMVRESIGRYPSLPLSLLSWSVDSSERSMHGALRRSSFADRIPRIVDAISRTSPDVLCLQDSSPALVDALRSATPSFRLLVSARNGLYGDVQTFLRVPSSWGATARLQYSFASVDLDAHKGKRLGPQERIRLVNSDWAYRGKQALDGDPFRVAVAGSNKRSLIADYLTTVVQPHVIVGSIPMASSMSIGAAQFHDLVGGRGRNSMTTDTMPMFDNRGPSEPLTHQTNFFYFAKPTFLVRRTKGVDLALPYAKLGTAVQRDATQRDDYFSECTSVLGRYQRCFLRRGSSAETSVCSRSYREITSTVLRPMDTVRVSQSQTEATEAWEVSVGCSDQFPLLVEFK